MKEVLAIVGAVLTLVSYVPYILDIIKKKTKPNVVSWTTWTMLMTIATAAAFAAGEWQAALLTLANAVGTFAILLLGMKNGLAKFSRFDGFCQAGALIALALWLIFNSPAVALVTVVCIDFLGILPTIRHSWQSPDEETWQTYFLCTIAPLFTLASLSAFHVENTLYPIYILVADAVVVAVILYRRKQLGISLAKEGVHSTLHE